MTSDAILAELRSLPPAPETLRERVLALPEPQPRFSWTLPRIDMRRFLLVAAPAIVALGVGAAALHGVLAGGSGTAQHLSYAPATQHAEAGRFLRGVRGAPSFQSAQGAKVQAPRAPQPTSLPAATTRLSRYEAWLRVRVADDRLSKATTRAMQIARGYGGYVASVDMNTPGKQGSSSLVLRVPVTKVEDAVLKLGKLGEVTAQRIRIEDLQRQANVLQRQILTLRTTIANVEHKLAAGGLSTGERVQLQYQLEIAKRTLAQKTKARASTVRDGTLSTISLAFSTPQPAAAVPHHQGRLELTVRDAGSFLLRELAWILYALIVLAPIALLAFAATIAIRTGRRRSETRLLEQS
jgi:Domain of unknown function (DUF4349)